MTNMQLLMYGQDRRGSFSLLKTIMLTMIVNSDTKESKMNSVHDILNAITEAKAAFDERPVLQTRIDGLERDLDKSQRHAQELELKLMERNAAIDSLQSKCRSLEVERDDMGFRELEAADKLDALRNVVKVFTTQVESLMPKSIEVAKAEPVSEPIPVTGAASGSYSPEPAYEGYRNDLVQEPHPIEAVGESASPLSPSATTTQDTETKTSVPTSASPMADVSSPKPYEGKTFSEVDRVINLPDWIEGGGTNANYWR